MYKKRVTALAAMRIPKKVDDDSFNVDSHPPITENTDDNNIQMNFFLGGGVNHDHSPRPSPLPAFLKQASSHNYFQPNQSHTSGIFGRMIEESYYEQAIPIESEDTMVISSVIPMTATAAAAVGVSKREKGGSNFLEDEDFYDFKHKIVRREMKPKYAKTPEERRKVKKRR